MMNENSNITSHNTRLAQKCLYGIFGFRKTPFRLRPLRHFAPPHFACPAKPTVSLIRAGKTSPTLNVMRNPNLKIMEIFCKILVLKYKI